MTCWSNVQRPSPFALPNPLAPLLDPPVQPTPLPLCPPPTHTHTHPWSLLPPHQWEEGQATSEEAEEGQASSDEGSSSRNSADDYVNVCCTVGVLPGSMVWGVASPGLQPGLPTRRARPNPPQDSDGDQVEHTYYRGELLEEEPCPGAAVGRSARGELDQGPQAAGKQVRGSAGLCACDGVASLLQQSESGCAGAGACGF